MERFPSPNPFPAKELPSPAIHRIDSAGQPAFGQEQAEEQTETENIASYIKDAQELIDGYRNFFATFAQDVSARFVIGQAFYIDFQTGIISLDARWFKEKKCSREQIVWAVLHELSHFKDLIRDPAGMTAMFAEIDRMATVTCGAIFDKYHMARGYNTPFTNSEVRQTTDAAFHAAKRIHHTFYNIFDDVHVNFGVSRHAPRYSAGTDGGDEVTRLYRDKLFKTTEYWQDPRHLQFIYALLRNEMVPGETLTLSSEVEAALETHIEYAGKFYTPKEILDTFIKPRSGTDTTTTTRHRVLRETLEPIFLQFLARDLADWNPKTQKRSPQEPARVPGRPPQRQPIPDDEEYDERAERWPAPEEDEHTPSPTDPLPGPFDAAYDDFEQNSPDQFSDRDIGNWAFNEATAQQTQREAEQRAADQASQPLDVQAVEFMEQSTIKPETLALYQQIERDIAPHLDDLALLWRKIAFGSSRGVGRAKETGHRTGTDVHIPLVVEAFPQIEKGQLADVRIMERVISKETRVMKPEQIRVRLMCDMSGSMVPIPGIPETSPYYQGPEKLETLQRTEMAILASLREFNSYLNISRASTKTKLTVDTEAIAFGSSISIIKPFRGGVERTAEEQTNIINSLEHLTPDGVLGGTSDDLALSYIESSLDAKMLRKIKEEKILEVVIEITDGVPDAPDETRERIDALLAKGVVVRAFQIGNIDNRSREIFNNVWNANRPEPLGETIGTTLDNLLPAVARLLKRYLSNVQL